MELSDLKKEYSELGKKYKLPSFKELNEAFEIEKIDKESDELLRVVRKVMMDKVVNWLGFIEMLLNPMNAPRMYFGYLKNLSDEDKKSIEEIYQCLGDVSLGSLECEVDYSEKGEAELINRIFKSWNEIKPKFLKMLGNMKKPNSFSEKRGGSYFG